MKDEEWQSNWRAVMQLLIFPVFIIDFAKDALTIEGRRATKSQLLNQT